MKKTGMLLITAVLMVSAHGIQLTLTEGGPVPVLSFAYSDGTPMTYARVHIFSPDDAVVEYQNGRTDKRGAFAFYPDRPGIWLIKIDDENGHETQRQILMRKEGSVLKAVIP
ncbi:MAG: hypothetical protein ACQEQV_05835 [Fibrobacterota bacterium]